MLWKDKTGSEPSFLSKAKEENTVMKSEKFLNMLSVVDLDWLNPDPNTDWVRYWIQGFETKNLKENSA